MGVFARGSALSWAGLVAAVIVLFLGSGADSGDESLLAQGACCMSDGTCEVLDPAECGDREGTYSGDETVCDPSVCAPSPTQKVTWGGLKAKMRREAEN